MSTDPPSLPSAWADDWAERENLRETVFRMGLLSVSVATRVYDDEALRRAVAEAGGPDVTMRFLFFSLCDVPGGLPPSALERLVLGRARTRFVDRLRERGFRDVERAETRTVSLDGVDATATRYVGACPVEDVTFDVEGWLLVWSDGAVRLAGGAYPTSVRGADERVVSAVRAVLAPERHRDDLFAIVRAVA